MLLGRLSRAKAQRRFTDMQQSGFAHRDTLDAAARAVREELVAAMPLVQGMPEYQMDLVGGLGLYRVLPPDRLTLRNAADDGVWRSLSLDLVPEIVLLRAGPNENLFWKSRWRLWLKRVWWYVHLGWQGDEARTRAALGQRTTDTIAQLVERPGNGFRVDLWRKIASRLQNREVSQDQFRRIMKLNTALLLSIEPLLSHGGLNGYVDRLYEAVGIDEGEEPRAAG